MEKKKRHRRTKAEMIAYRAAKAQKNIDKYKAKIEKKLETKGYTNSSNSLKFYTTRTEIDDGKFWDMCSITGTEAEMNEFYKANKENCIAVPYLYCGNTYRVNYWKERT